MQLTIFGATGATGRLLVQRALDAGHGVVAYARTPGKLGIEHDRLRVVQGGLDDAAAIGEAVRGADAVISLLGPAGRSPGQPIAAGTRLIVEAMGEHGVRRLVAVATPSARDPRDRFDPRFDPMILAIRVLVGSAYEDIVATAEAVRSSPLDWTLVRIPLLTDKPSAAAWRTGYAGLSGDGVGVRLARANLAAFLLSAAEEDRHVGEAPVVSNAVR